MISPAAVLDRFPVPKRDGEPACFGAGYGPKLPCCTCCAFAGECAQKVKAWSGRMSLSQLIADTERRCSAVSQVDEDGDTRLVQTYVRHYSQCFGNPPRITKRDTRVVRAMARVDRTCAAEGLDVDAWVAAQMFSLRKFLKTFRVRGRLLGFQPNMMLGARARERYNEFIRRNRRRYRTRDASAAFTATPFQRAVRMLCEEDTRVGAYYVAARLAGDPVDFREAARRVSASAAWVAMQEWDRDLTDSVCRDTVGVGEREARDAMRLARLEAVARACGRFDAQLPDRLSFPSGAFEWDAFAAFVTSRYARRQRQAMPALPDGIGLVWKRPSNAKNVA